MTNPSGETQSTDRLAARLLDAEKEVTAASSALREFIKAGERYSSSSKSLDEAVIALAPVSAAIQQAATALASAVSALQSGMQALQGSDPVRLRQEIGDRIGTLDTSLKAMQLQLANIVKEVHLQRDAGADRGKALQSLVARVEAREARLQHLILGGFAVMGVGFAVIAYGIVRF